jgi:hypothetical protein
MQTCPIFRAMSDEFELPVTYNGKELLFPAVLLPMGYTHKIKVTVDKTELLFEPDEEKNYRATLPDADRDAFNKLDTQLLRAICQTLDELFGSGN